MTPPSRPEQPHEHQWKREYAPGYRQASEANDWREECSCGAVRTGTDAPMTEQPEQPTLDQLWDSMGHDVAAIGWRQAVAFWRHPIQQAIEAQAAAPEQDEAVREMSRGVSAAAGSATPGATSPASPPPEEDAYIQGHRDRYRRDREPDILCLNCGKPWAIKGADAPPTVIEAIHQIVNDPDQSAASMVAIAESAIRSLIASPPPAPEQDEAVRADEAALSLVHRLSEPRMKAWLSSHVTGMHWGCGVTEDEGDCMVAQLAALASPPPVPAAPRIVENAYPSQVIGGVPRFDAHVEPPVPDPWCRVDEQHTHSGVTHYGPHLWDAQDALPPLDPLSVQEADMCPNCVTPWKCNGPHLQKEDGDA